MPNSYYTPAGNPLTRALSNSAYMRAEFSALQAAFDRLPTPLVGQQGFSAAILTSPTFSAAAVTGASTWYNGTVYPDKLAGYYLATSYASPSAAFSTSGYCGLYRSSKTNNPFSFVFASNALPADDDYLLFDKYGNVIFGNGTAAKGTTATDSFLMIPTCAGAPTGVPAHTYASSVPIIFDSTNNKIYVYDGGWIATAALT